MKSTDSTCYYDCSDNKWNPEELPAGIGVDRRGVEDEPIEVGISRIKPERVEARPAAEGGGIVAETEVV